MPYDQESVKKKCPKLRRGSSSLQEWKMQGIYDKRNKRLDAIKKKNL